MNKQSLLNFSGRGIRWYPRLKFLSIRGKDEVQRFLRNLGFIEGAEVTVISELGGNVIVSVKGTRVAVSKSMAARVVTG